MIANSRGQDLIKHLEMVALLGKKMGEKLCLSNELCEKIFYAGLLHDIGKVTDDFQNYMNILIGNQALIIDDDFIDPINSNPLHHEIGWAYLTQKFFDPYILGSIYWHHSRPIHLSDNKKIKYDTADDILYTLSDSDTKALDNIWNILKSKITTTLPSPYPMTMEIPSLFEKDGGQSNKNTNAEFMLIRGCVISADRYISSLSNIENINVNNIIDQILSGEIKGVPIKPPNYDNNRYNFQLDIVNSIKENTTIIKAPAGLGKTLIGILWSQKTKGKVVWVCPRNVVADTVYKNITKEIKALGLSCTIELFRTGSRQNFIGPDRPEFCSDIIVTNIDTVMSPMVKNNVAGRLFTLYGANVVLDEFHEFVSDSPLFAAFVTYMRARHRVSSSKTLLLSATPSLIQVLWDTADKKTQIIPNENEHCSAAHQGTYEICFKDSFPSNPVKGSVLICNAVSSAQDNFKKGYTHLIHHRYTDRDRQVIQENIYNSFEKHKKGVENGESLSAALVVQAAMDISFRELFDSVSSPESTLQRIGRVDRWGTFQNLSPKINFFDMSSDKSEKGAINVTYDLKLQKLWVAFLKEKLNNISHINLNHLYKIYNKFNETYKKEILCYLIKKYQYGINGKNGNEFLGLVSFNPIKILGAETIKKNKISCKNLRSPDGSYFYTVALNTEKNKWLGPDDILSEGYELYNRYIENNKLNKELLENGPMLTRLKGLVNSGFSGWSKQSRGKNKMPSSLKDWFRRARNPETPLPDFSRKYDPVLGVIKL